MNKTNIKCPNCHSDKSYKLFKYSCYLNTINSDNTLCKFTIFITTYSKQSISPATKNTMLIT